MFDEAGVPRRHSSWARRGPRLHSAARSLYARRPGRGDRTEPRRDDPAARCARSPTACSQRTASAPLPAGGRPAGSASVPTPVTCSSPTSAPRASTSQWPTSPARSSSTGQSPRHRCRPRRGARPGRGALRGSASPRQGRTGALWGIGIGVPGPVEFESGRPVSPPIMPGWDGYRVRGALRAVGVPVWVDNDVNVMALGELTAGCGRGRDDFVFVKIGTGIGAGIIVDGRIHRGAKGSAGDIGHIQIAGRPRGDLPLRDEPLPRGPRRRSRARAGREAAAREGRSDSCAPCSTRRASSTRPTSPPPRSTATRSASS